MDRAQKQETIESLKGVFSSSGAVVVTHYLGLTVAEMTDLRGRLRNEGAQLKVVKNTLAQKALDGSVGEAGDALFKGPVAIAFAPDPVSAAKVATQYAKDNDKFSVVGGFMGQQVLDKTSITAVAAPAAAPAGAAPAEAAEEQTEFTVVLTGGGDKKINVIKEVRSVRPDLGLKEAKDLVEGAPQNVKENISKQEAEEIKKKLTEAGATVSIK